MAASRHWSRKLVRAVLAAAARRGVREVFLEVRVSNTCAQKLYERHGFTEVGRRRNYYLEPVEDALVMRHQVQPEAVTKLNEKT